MGIVMAVLDPEFWVVLVTLTVLGAATAIGLTLLLERWTERLAARPPRPAPARPARAGRHPRRHHHGVGHAH
ncbi:hypothetical protein ABH931_007083 [Streptacidiphilus sp. MAP12-33]|uniref:hypothetical protein n=1 Tax=Streptacidiphilus sp. MAP12-33 TaxID=3156266 RepID=UPI0035192712